MEFKVLTVLLGILVGSSIALRYRTYQHNLGIPTNRPLNIGHRGSCGVFPEHTVEAYKKAILDGADFIECDMVITKDQQFVCRHEPYLSTTTDVKDRPEFENYTRTYLIDGANKTDWFTSEFTLDELKTLKVHQHLEFRDQSHNWKYDIASFEEYLDVVREADRPVGIYPELKQPVWTNSLSFMEGKRMEDLALDVLRQYGYQKKTDRCLLQCFEFESVEYLVKNTELPVMMLVWEDHKSTDDLLEKYANISYGIGIWKSQVSSDYTNDNGYKNWLGEPTKLIEKSHNLGMKVHLYTMRNEDQYLAWNFEQDPWKEYDYYMAMGIEGYFTDFPATFKRYLDYAYTYEGGEIETTPEDNVCGNAATGFNVKWSYLYICILLLLL